ncbi:FimB/Mfa2 family fimbrial subunit [Bacteroides sp. 224]|uniref:FimB/Mfa2 family fimbrial subunit n=1 Tax=Bacteroides sp. 224 TaxID=2302936 RepID=UPI0013D4BA6C|nr:FimB/Mfa2 family fimbrial subunit [Bacteroides sp. 224]NDV66224.1 hypothetical protein [Bacteroides sp. 224]
MKHLRPIKKNLLQFFCATISLLLLSGCLNDDTDHCSPGAQEISVLLKCDINTTGTDVFTSVVKHVDLYIYNAITGILHQTETLNKEQLESEDYLHKLSLLPGNYILVAWMNQNTEYENSDTRQLTAARMKLKFGKTGEITTDTEPIYFGRNSLSVGEKDEHITLNLMKNTNYIKVNAHFNHILPPSSVINSYIVGTNGVYDFDNNCPGDAPVYTYMPVQHPDTRAAYTHPLSFTTQRLMVGDDLRLIVTLQDEDRPLETLIDISLTGTIRKNPDYATQQALDRNDTYQLDFDFEYNGYAHVLTGIQVNDWKVDNSVGGL